MGRLGLLIHSTAGYVDPGWKGTLTLELSTSRTCRSPCTPGCGSGRSASSGCRARSSGRTAAPSSGRSTRGRASPRLRPPTATSTRGGGCRRPAPACAATSRPAGRLTADGRGAQRRRPLVGRPRRRHPGRARPGRDVPLGRGGDLRPGAARSCGASSSPTRSTSSHRLLQALNCLLVETPAGRVLVETGIGERLDERGRAWRGYGGDPIVPTLERAGFDPTTVDIVAMSHLHYDHAGGLLRADGSRAFPRARIVAQRAEWEMALSDNPRIVASYDQPELRLVRCLGRRGRRRRRGRAAAGRLRRPDRRPHGRAPGDPRPGPGPDAGLLRRHRDAAVVGQPALDPRLRRLPARLGRLQGDASSRGRRRSAGRSSSRTSCAIPWAASSPTATGSPGSRSPRATGALDARRVPIATAAASRRPARPAPGRARFDAALSGVTGPCTMDRMTPSSSMK